MIVVRVINGDSNQMSWNEVLLVVLVVLLLFSGIIFRFALYYRNQIKNLKDELEERKRKVLIETKAIIDQCATDLKKYDAEIKIRDEKIEKLKQELQHLEEEGKATSYMK
ncbi:hypothetical protein [Bartonella quintana]|uniref:hypothetical protein n=1 Tax=Bartonella quintana TaxID=803 RepID=UPI001F0ABE26|nr:hypothetical protein [Bartonella quintana]